MSAPKQLNARKVAKAISDANGLLSFAAQALGCSRQMVYKYVEKYPACRQAVDEARDKFVDVGESKLMKAVAREEPWAIAMQLRTLGRKRGYVERQESEITGSGGAPLTLRLVIDDNPTPNIH